jgi:hypothetical protein
LVGTKTWTDVAEESFLEPFLDDPRRCVNAADVEAVRADVLELVGNFAVHNNDVAGPPSMS